MFSKLAFNRPAVTSARAAFALRNAALSSKPAPTLSAETIRIVKSTAPVIAEHGYQITKTMYGRMLKAPEIKEMFNPTHQVELPGEKYAFQPKTLADSIHAYAANIDNLGALTEAVERIAQKHVSVYVLPEQYAVVKENLFWALGQVLGSAITPEVGKAWSEAYDFLAHIFIERERQIRDEKKNAPGGWEGYKPFTVAERIVENHEVTSFILKPKDGKVISYQPGSYVGVQVNTPNGRTVRNYTLSAPFIDGKTNTYRITVKKTPPIAAGPHGVVSNMLHSQMEVGSTINVGVPCGDFTLQLKDNKPIVLISGGVGITPTVSMFEYLMEKNVPNKVFMINAFRNPSAEIMHDEIQKYAHKKPDAVVSQMFDTLGSLPSTATIMDTIAQNINGNKDAHYYFCGPHQFMRKVHEGLKGWNIPANQIHFEFFGPTGSF